MAENPQAAWTAVYCLREYNPYRLMGELNPAFNKATDGRLLDLKYNYDRGVHAAAEDFRQGLHALGLANGTILVVVPGHEASASNVGRPLARVAQLLATLDKRYLASVDTLIRIQTVPKKTDGGSRDIAVDLGSIIVRPSVALKSASVVVLDDTVTTGGSLTAARQLLTSAGVKKIAAVAIGRTVKYF
jgi:predicted amidophosphoribosyltransferase